MRATIPTSSSSLASSSSPSTRRRSRVLMASSSSTSLATCHRDVVAFVKSYEDESLTVASGKGGGGGGGGNVALFERRRRRASRRTKMRDVVVSAAASADDVDDDDDDAKKSSSSTVGVLSQILAGITVSLAMVPESLSFTFVAGVSPIVGLHAAGLMGLACALFNAQPGVISGAAGATAVVIAPLVASKGVEYLFACCALCGAMQVLAGAMRLGKFIRLVPQPVMLGFVNGLAIVIGKSQLEHFHGLSGSALSYTVGLTALTMALIKLFQNMSRRKFRRR